MVAMAVALGDLKDLPLMGGTRIPSGHCMMLMVVLRDSGARMALRRGNRGRNGHHRQHQHDRNDITNQSQTKLPRGLRIIGISPYSAIRSAGEAVFAR